MKDRICDTARLNVLDTIKSKSKKSTRIYYFVYDFFFLVLFPGKSYTELLSLVPEGKLIVNLGSGPRRLPHRVINFDLAFYNNVDVVEDVHNLPFRDNVLSGVINTTMLEHTKNPELVIREIYRMVKPGGYVYTHIPFI